MKMKRKLSLAILITFVFICLISVNVFATVSTYTNNEIEPRTTTQNQTTEMPINTNQQEQNKTVKGDGALPEKQKTELLNLKETSRTSLEKYKAKFKNNAIYGTIGYILNIVRLTSIPFFVIGILISIVYEYIVGMKRREMVRKGRGLRITMISIFVVAQILPLIFVIVIKFWGN